VACRIDDYFIGTITGKLFLKDAEFQVANHFYVLCLKNMENQHPSMQIHDKKSQ
jgi:hypothetical protein